MAVHVLGNATDMTKFMEIVEKNNLLLIEDNCESLGSKHKDKYLGTFGQFGTTSFFFSHHMTTGEGGF
jgi:CDP-6-deoxy-D-xylo-4-hexulose-3-dehydrase